MAILPYFRSSNSQVQPLLRPQFKVVTDMQAKQGDGSAFDQKRLRLGIVGDQRPGTPIFDWNVASQAVARKAGYALEGRTPVSAIKRWADH